MQCVGISKKKDMSSFDEGQIVTARLGESISTAGLVRCSHDAVVSTALQLQVSDELYN